MSTLKETIVITCPECNGEGEIFTPSGHPEPDCDWEDCRICDTKGELNPIERIKELLAEAAGAEADYYIGLEVKNALASLVDLKTHKDKYGKDDEYLKLQPIVWRKAKKALEL